MVINGDIFDQLWKARGTEFHAQDEEMRDFLSEHVWADGESFMDVVRVSNLADVSTVDMNSWASVLAWVTDSSASFYSSWMDDEEQSETPLEYFGSSENLLSEVIQAIVDENSSSSSVWSVSVESGERSLKLIYSDLECWGLGFGDSVLVVENFSEISKHPNYFDY